MARITLSQWYRNMNLPQWGASLEQFVMPTMGLLSEILPGRSVNLPVVFVNDLETAAADQINGRILIGKNTFSFDPTKRLNAFADRELAVSAALGFVVHEGLHFAYSPKTIKEALKPGVAENDMTLAIANVVEDVFIEAQCLNLHPNLAWMIFSAWEYMFDPRIDKGLDCWDGVTVDAKNLGNIINRMITWKDQVKVFNFASDFEEALYNALYSVRGVTQLSGRMDIIENIINMLKQEMKAQGNEESEEKEEGKGKQGKSKGKGKGKGEGKASAGSEKAEEDEEAEAEAAGGKEDSEEDSEEDDEEEDDSEEEEENPLDAEDSDGGTPSQFAPDGKPVSVSEVLNAYGDNSKEYLPRESEGFVDVEALNGRAVYTAKPSSAKGTLAFDPKWKKFAEFANQRGAVRYVAGNAAMSGKKLTHPQNIKDGTVFSTGRLDSVSGSINRGHPQIVLLLDFSGSMRRNDKYGRTVQAAYGASVGLGSAGIPHAIYGYTTDYAGGRECVIMHELKEMRETAAQGQARLVHVHNNWVDLNYTPDVEAVEYAAKRLVANGSDRIIIVISDGTPECDGYSGNAGKRLAIETVAKVRAQGIRVFGLSIDASANRSVQEIYGKDSLCDSDPNAIEKFVHSLV